VVHPAVKFRVISQDQKWQCDFSAERSALSATAAFTALTVFLKEVRPQIPFVEKHKLMRAAADVCFAVVGLENANVSQT
jgi:hypothetical protein